MRSKSGRPLALLAAVALLLLPPPERAGADAGSWRQRFAKADADEVWQSIEQAGDQKAADAAAPLFEAGLAAKFPHIAVGCGEALKRIGYPADAAARAEADKLIDKALKSKEELPLRNLARILGAWGHPMVDEPMGVLASGRRTPEVQVEALFLCGYLVPREGAPFSETGAAIEKAIKGRSPEIRMAACSAAGRRREARFTESLVSLVRSEKENYPGLYAVWALKQIGASPGVDTFVHVLESNPKRSTRQACLKAVTELSTEKEIPALLSLTRSSKTDYRDAACLALGRLAWRKTGPCGGGGGGPGGGNPGAPSITPGEEPPAPAPLPPPGPAPLPQGAMPPEVIDRLFQIIAEDSDWEVRDAARQALLRIGEPAAEKARQVLPGLVDASNEDARLTAIELAGLFRVTGEPIAKALWKIALFDRNAPARIFAARALEGVGATQAATEFLRYADSNPKSGEGLAAVRALGYLRTPEALEGLLQFLGKPGLQEPFLREVEYALERLTGHRFGRNLPRWRDFLAKTPRPFDIRPKHFDRAQNRRKAVTENLYGITPETEKAVEDGLRWLELQQHGTGEWDGNEKGFGGVVNCQPAYTGLSLLAFLGAGYGDREGKYHETLRRAAEFLGATQFYDGGYPVSGGGDDSWIFAYLVAMAVWGLNETHGLSGDPLFCAAAQWGIDYLVRVQTPGAGWRYGPRYIQSDTSCTSWVLMTIKTADLSGLTVAQKCWDGIDSWLERCSYDITGEEEIPADLSNDYDHEVGARRMFKAFVGYFELSGGEKSAAQQTSMTAVGMICRFFMGWHRSHPLMIGCGNYLMDFPPQWMKGLEKGQAVAWYHYYWYYATLAMHQMGGRYWRFWNDKIKRMLLANRRTSPPELFGSWDPDPTVLNGGRLFSTPMAILTLQTYYRFSPILAGADTEKGVPPPAAGDPKPPGGDGAAPGGPGK